MELDEAPVPSGLTQLQLADRLFKQACKVRLLVSVTVMQGHH